MQNSFDDLEEKFIKLTEYCIRFSEKFNYKLIICKKRSKDKIVIGNKKIFSDFNQENNGYKLKLNKKFYQLYKKNFVKRNSNKFQTYKLMEESEICISTMSTMLRENIYLGNKIFAVNLTNHSPYNFPIKKLISLNNDNYQEFEKKILFVLKMNKKKYNKAIQNYRYKFISNSKSTKHDVRKIIKEFLIID